jgi:crossover junction endodeoxyribonuclease RuvC
MNIFAVDPGLNGAAAVLDSAGRIVDCFDLPTIGKGTQRRVDAANLADLIRAHAPYTFAMVELVNSWPKQGVASTFRFGASYGTMLGVIGALAIPVRHVSPPKWKKALGLNSDAETSRAGDRDLANSRRPVCPQARSQGPGRFAWAVRPEDRWRLSARATCSPLRSSVRLLAYRPALSIFWPSPLEWRAVSLKPPEGRRRGVTFAPHERYFEICRQIHAQVRNKAVVFSCALGNFFVLTGESLSRAAAGQRLGP